MASLVMEPVPANPWYNIVNAQCTLRERPEPDPVLPVQITGAGNAPFNVQVDQPLFIDFQWSQNGFFAGANLAAILNFEIKFLFEAFGSTEVNAGLDFQQVVPYQAGVGFNYNPGSVPTTRITIPPGTVPPGVYSCAAVFQVNLIPSGQKYFAGYVDFPVINFYHATV